MGNTYHAWNDSVSSDYDSGSDNINGVDNGGTNFILNDTGSYGYDSSNAANPETFTGGSSAGLVETPTADVGESTQFTDQSTTATQINNGTFTTTLGSTDNDNGTDYSITDNQGSEPFSATSGTLTSGNGTQVAGTVTFGLDDEYVDHFSDVSTSYNVGNYLSTLERNTSTSHSDNGGVDWLWDLHGSDTFTMQASDADTGISSWDIGTENYFQTQSLTASFSDNTSASSAYDGGMTTSGSGSSHGNGGSDTLSTGDQVDHNYGVVFVDPTTSDIASSTGLDDYDLGKTYSDTYTNLSSGKGRAHDHPLRQRLRRRHLHRSRGRDRLHRGDRPGHRRAQHRQ